jgi:hypothetical protein
VPSRRAGAHARCRGGTVPADPFSSSGQPLRCSSSNVTASTCSVRDGGDILTDRRTGLHVCIGVHGQMVLQRWWRAEAVAQPGGEGDGGRDAIWLTTAPARHSKKQETCQNFRDKQPGQAQARVPAVILCRAEFTRFQCPLTGPVQARRPHTRGAVTQCAFARETRPWITQAGVNALR